MQRDSDAFTGPAAQPGVLFPAQKQFAFIIVHLKPTVAKSRAKMNEVKDVLAKATVVEQPPYTPNPKIPEGILTQLGRLSEASGAPNFSSVFGVSTERYSKFFDGPPPAGMTHFKARESADGNHSFPKTGGDIFFHLKAGVRGMEPAAGEAWCSSCDPLSLIDQAVKIVTDGLGPYASSTYVRKGNGDTTGRNQFGFFDGGADPAVTANPILTQGPSVCSYPEGLDTSISKIDPSVRKEFGTKCVLESIQKQAKAAAQARQCRSNLVDLGSSNTTFMGAGSDHQNGCFAMYQHYEHDLDAFEKLSAEAQDNVFGRQKESGAFVRVTTDNPLGGNLNRQLPQCHIVRTHIRMTCPATGTADVDPLVQNGPAASLAPLQINRQAVPFQTEAGVKGLAFVAYGRDTVRFDQILDRMIGHNVTWPKKGDHSTDSLLDYTQAKSGNYFYIPNLQEINQLSLRSALPKEEYDVVIVGAGPSGLHSGVELLAKHPEKNIAIFEQANYVGGRVYTVTPPGMPDLPTELGGMRVVSTQEQVLGLIKKYNLTLEPFYTDEPENPLHARGALLRNKQFVNPQKVFELYPNIKMTPEQIAWGPFLSLLMLLGVAFIEREGHLIPKEKNIDAIRKMLMGLYVNIDGKVCGKDDPTAMPLYSLSIHSLILMVFGTEAFEYSKTIVGYYAPLGDSNCVDSLVDNLGDFANPGAQYSKLKEGYSELFECMAKDFKDLGGDLFLQFTLQSFTYNTEKSVFECRINDMNIACKKLILAMPKGGLQRISAPELANTEVQDLINRVRGRPFHKAYLCYDTPWWDAGLSTPLKGRSVTDQPVRQAYYWGTSKQTGKAGILIYDDGVNPWFWDGLQKFTDALVPVERNWKAVERETTGPLCLEAHRLFTTFFDADTLDDEVRPYAFASLSWTPEGISGGGVNFWNPGIDSDASMKAVVNPIADLPLYIVGSCYSHAQGWVEGALDTTKLMLMQYFGFTESDFPAALSPDTSKTAVQPMFEVRKMERRRSFRVVEEKSSVEGNQVPAASTRIHG